jgi:hypothetical protein
MSTAGPNLAGTGTSVSTGNGTGTAWTNPGNVTADDATNATITSGATTTQFLTATNFGFSIPSGATITGLQFTIERFRGSTRLAGGGVFDNEVFAVKGGTNLTSNRAYTNTSDWGTILGTTVDYGTASDLWGGTFIDTDINASNFGVALSARQAGAQCNVDCVKATITYFTSIPTSASATTGTVANDASAGTDAWTNASNATAEDGAVASAAINTSDTQYLKATNFGFSIPSGATINGIVVKIKKGSTNNEVRDAAIRIVKGGSIGSTDKSTSSRWPSTLTFHYHGAADNLWGETWTDTDINASNFGVAIRAQWDSLNSVNINDTAKVDVVQIQVYYTGGGGGGGGGTCKQEAMGVIRSW